MMHQKTYQTASLSAYQMIEEAVKGSGNVSYTKLRDIIVQKFGGDYGVEAEAISRSQLITLPTGLQFVYTVQGETDITVFAGKPTDEENTIKFFLVQ